MEWSSQTRSTDVRKDYQEGRRREQTIRGGVVLLGKFSCSLGVGRHRGVKGVSVAGSGNLAKVSGRTRPSVGVVGSGEDGTEDSKRD